jgi:hypothetical protein
MRPLDVAQSARPGMVLLTSILVSGLIGRHYGEPVLGVGIGFGVGAIINGVWDYQNLSALERNIGE